MISRCKRRRRCAVAAASLALVVEARSNAQTTATWLNPVSGQWTVASNWSSNPFAPIDNSPSGTSYIAGISAPGGPYTVTLGTSLTVTGVQVSTSGAQVLVNSATLTTGSVDLSGGGQFTLQNATLKNATITGAGSFNFAPSSTGILENVTLATNLTATNISVRNGLTFAGTNRVLTDDSNLPGGDGGPNMHLYGSQSIQGVGTIVLNGDAMDIRQDGASQAVITLNPGITLTNGATADGRLETQYATTGKLINKGLIWANNGAKFVLDTVTWTNQGTLRVSANSTLILGGVYSVGSPGTELEFAL